MISDISPLGPLVLRRFTGAGPERGERADGLVGEEDGTQADAVRLAAELRDQLRRADPVAVTTSLPGGVTGKAPEVEARVPPHRGVECRDPRRNAEDQAGLLVGDDDLAARVQRRERLSRSRLSLGEGSGQLGAAVACSLAQ